MSMFDEMDEELPGEVAIEEDDLAPDWEVDASGENAKYWNGELPGREPGEGGLYVEGIYPTTQLERRALMLTSKQSRKDALLRVFESQEALLRLCLKRIGDQEVGWDQLRGKGLDKYLSGPQKQMLSEFFERTTQATEEETERFLMTVRRGRRVR